MCSKGKLEAFIFETYNIMLTMNFQATSSNGAYAPAILSWILCTSIVCIVLSIRRYLYLWLFKQTQMAKMKETKLLNYSKWLVMFTLMHICQEIVENLSPHEWNFFNWCGPSSPKEILSYMHIHENLQCGCHILFPLKSKGGFEPSLGLAWRRIKSIIPTLTWNLRWWSCIE